MNSKRNQERRGARPVPMRLMAVQRGVTLVELMVAMVLGLFLIGGFISAYLSTQQNFKANENLSRIQENARFAFEQMSREIREAGTNPCGAKAVSSVIRTASATIPWWSDWESGAVIGYEAGAAAADVPIGSTLGDRSTGTDAITVMRTAFDDAALAVIQSQVPGATSMTLSKVSMFEEKDILMACDQVSGAVFQASTVSAGPKEIDYENSGASMNCTVKLGWPLPADCTSPVAKTFSASGFVAKHDPAFWYVGPNAAGSRSLYRLRIKFNGTGLAKRVITERMEMVVNVHDLQLEYLTRNKATAIPTLASEWINADNALLDGAAKGWTDKNLNEVVAVRVELTFRSADAVGTDGKPLERKTYFVIGLRNRDLKS